MQKASKQVINYKILSKNTSSGLENNTKSKSFKFFKNSITELIQSAVSKLFMIFTFSK